VGLLSGLDLDQAFVWLVAVETSLDAVGTERQPVDGARLRAGFGDHAIDQDLGARRRDLDAQRAQPTLGLQQHPDCLADALVPLGIQPRHPQLTRAEPLAAGLVHVGEGKAGVVRVGSHPQRQDESQQAIDVIQGAREPQGTRRLHLGAGLSSRLQPAGAGTGHRRVDRVDRTDHFLATR